MSGKDKEIFELKRELVDTNAEKNLMQRRLNAYETEGGAAGGGDVFDLKEKVRLLEERGLRHAQERDEALGKARDLEWKLKESETKYGTSQRFRSAEQKKFEALQKARDEALESVADERKAAELVKTANEEKRLLREAEFGRKVLLAALICIPSLLTTHSAFCLRCRHWKQTISSVSKRLQR
jgi:hypothetical protein